MPCTLLCCWCGSAGVLSFHAAAVADALCREQGLVQASQLLGPEFQIPYLQPALSHPLERIRADAAELATYELKMSGAALGSWCMSALVDAAHEHLCAEPVADWTLKVLKELLQSSLAGTILNTNRSPHGSVGRHQPKCTSKVA